MWVGTCQPLRNGHYIATVFPQCFHCVSTVLPLWNHCVSIVSSPVETQWKHCGNTVEMEPSHIGFKGSDNTVATKFYSGNTVETQWFYSGDNAVETQWFHSGDNTKKKENRSLCRIEPTTFVLAGENSTTVPRSHLLFTWVFFWFKRSSMQLWPVTLQEAGVQISKLLCYPGFVTTVFPLYMKMGI